MMDKPFPAGFPLETGFYMFFYVLTLVIHVVFMNYVLAGMGYLAVRAVAGRRSGDPGINAPKARVLREWMPFALGLAITAGVAPLLFVQILYKHSFYTSNLLGFHRWMSVLPVLIVGYYLIYIYRTERIECWSGFWKVAIGVVAFLCFAFTAYSWTENHLLGMNQAVWAEQFKAQSMVYWEGPLLPRLGMWFIGAIPTMCVLVALQLRHRGRRGESLPDQDPKRTSYLALAGMSVAVVCGLIYYLVAEQATRQAFTSAMALPYLIVAVLGLGLQAAAWWMQSRQTAYTGKLLALAAAGTALSIIGATVVREAIRVAHKDMQALLPHHREAFGKAGFPTFLVFFVVVAILMAGSVVIVRRNLQPAQDEQPPAAPGEQPA